MLSIISGGGEWFEAVREFIDGAPGEMKYNTIRGYAWHLRALAEWATKKEIGLDQFRGRHMRQFVAARAATGGREGSGRSEKTLREDCIAAKAFFNFCVRPGKLIECNPLHDYEFPKATIGQPGKPSSEQLQRLFRAVEDSWNPKVNPKIRFCRDKERRFFCRRDYAILAVLVETGTRIGDVVRLKLSDYDPAERILRIRKPKDKKPREVPITAGLIAAILAWKKVRPACDSDLLFISQFGDEIAVNAFGKSFRRYRSFAGLEGFSLHGIKHYVVTTTTNEVGIAFASQLTGTSITTLERHYLHRVTPELRKKHEAVDLLGRVLVNRRTQRGKREKVI